MVSIGDLHPASEQGWRIGFINLLRKETRRRWNIRNLLIQSAVWLLLLNFVLALLLEAEASRGSIMMGITTFIFMVSMLAPLGMVMTSQGAILNEKKSGTAAWILSKPASRSAFVLSKLVTIIVGFVAIVIVLQGVVAYSQLSLFQGSMLPAIPFIGGMLLLSLNVAFYLALTLMLGTLFHQRVPIIGIPVALIIIQAFLLSLLAGVADWLPYLFPGSLSDLARAAVMESPMPSQWLLAIVTTSLLTVLFICVAIWRFQREEF